MANFIVADDHPFVRQGIKSFLNNTANHQVIAECDSGPATISKVMELQPDGLIVDLDLPGLDGLEVVRRVHKLVPRTKIIVLTMHSSAAFVMVAFRNGASAYLLKSADVSDLGIAVDQVFRSDRFISPHIDMITGEETEWVDLYETLTDREKEVLQLIVEGWKVEEIAERLHIRPATVGTHRTNILRKLDVHNEADVIRFAVERGLVHLRSADGDKDNPSDSREHRSWAS